MLVLIGRRVLGSCSWPALHARMSIRLPGTGGVLLRCAVQRLSELKMWVIAFLLNGTDRSNTRIMTLRSGRLADAEREKGVLDFVSEAVLATCSLLSSVSPARLPGLFIVTARDPAMLANPAMPASPARNHAAYQSQLQKQH
jgi:hypothetical protein